MQMTHGWKFVQQCEIAKYSIQLIMSQTNPNHPIYNERKTRITRNKNMKNMVINKNLMK